MTSEHREGDPPEPPPREVRSGQVMSGQSTAVCEGRVSEDKAEQPIGLH